MDRNNAKRINSLLEAATDSILKAEELFTGGTLYEDAAFRKHIREIEEFRKQLYRKHGLGPA